MAILAERPEIAPRVIGDDFDAEFAVEREGDEIQGRFENNAVYGEWKIRARLGIYLSDHPLTIYAQGLLGKIQDPKDKDGSNITVYKGEPNAFVFPSGETFISDQLLTFAQTEEEILWILRHEKVHQNESHTEKEYRRAEDAERHLSSIVFGDLGQRRLHEWEGDIRGFDELNELGINPMGGINIMERVRLDPKVGKDLAHGKSTDRVLNMRLMTHVKDLPAIEKPMHPIPSEIKSAVQQEQKEGRYTSKYNQLIEALESWSHINATRMIEAMDLNQILGALPKVIRMYDDPSVRLDSFTQREIITLMGRKIWGELSHAANFDGRPPTPQETTILFFGVLNLALGQETGRYREYSLEQSITTKEDLETVMKVLSQDTFTQLGLKINADPDHLIERIINRAMEQMLFDDEEGNLQFDKFSEFATSMVENVGRLYLEHGLIEIDLDETYQTMIEAAGGYLNKEDRQRLIQMSEERKPFALVLGEAERANIQRLEKEYGDRLVNIFHQFAREYDDLSKGKKEKDFNEAKYLVAIRKLFRERGMQQPQDILTFLANFRKTLSEDPELWGLHLLYDDLWNPLLDKVISSQRRVFSHLPHPLEKTLFQLKIGLLLAHNYSSNIVNSPSRRKGFRDFMDHADLDIEWYKSFYGLASKGDVLAGELGIDVAADPVLGFGKNEEWVNIFKQGKAVLLERAFHSLPRDEFSRILELLTREFPLEPSKEDRDLSDRKTKFLNEVFKNFSFDLTSVRDLKDLYYLSTYLPDHSLTVRLQAIIWQRLTQEFSFEEGFAFLEQELGDRRLISVQALTNFIEEKAQTHEQIEMARERLLKMLTQESSLEAVGKMVISEDLWARFLLEDKLGFLQAAIGNGENDTHLKRFLYKRWVDCFQDQYSLTIDHLDLDYLQQRLYRLDAQSKYVLIRDLLTGDKGILMDRYQRRELVDFFLDNYVQVTDEQDAKLFAAIREVVERVVDTASYDLLYFALSPILQERILRPTTEGVSWRDVIRSEIPPRGYEKRIEIRTFDELEGPSREDLAMEEEVIGRDRLKPDYYDLTGQGEVIGEDDSAIYSQILDLGNALEMDDVEEVDEKNVDELYGFITGTKRGKDIKDVDELRREYEDIINSLLADFESSPDRLKMTVNEFLLETAQKLGAPGVRFLQLIGQYIDLPPNLEQAFNAVYDKVGGQSKMTADQTLLREWQGGRETLAGLLERLGGGSLMSVFRTEASDGRDLALKILNPNAGYHTDTTYKLLTEVFTALSQRKPQYAPSLSLLEDIKEWIRGDIDFTGFVEMDQRFRQKHNGYSTGGDYRIKVPISYPPENKYFGQEEFIEGINLTDLETLQQQGHDLKQVVSLTAKNFLEQVKDGLVHSDIHPGNIRVTPNNEVAILDRNFYVQLSLSDRFFLWNLQNSLGNIAQATEMSLNYLRSSGVAVTNEQKDRVMEQVDAISQIPDPTDRLLRMTVTLRKEGVRFPLRVTLLIKNFFYLDRMAKRVGYSGLAEALRG